MVHLYLYQRGKKTLFTQPFCIFAPHSVIAAFVIKSVVSVATTVVVDVMGPAAPACLAPKTKHLWNASVAPSPVGRSDEAFGGNISGMASC